MTTEELYDLMSSGDAKRVTSRCIGIDITSTHTISEGLFTINRKI